VENPCGLPSPHRKPPSRSTQWSPTGGDFAPPGNIWQRLETNLVFLTGEVLLASSEEKPGMLP